jgi:hypothetical protein
MVALPAEGGLDGLAAHVAELVRACWELGAAPNSKGSDYGRGRTCSASEVTGRLRAAATPPP